MGVILPKRRAICSIAALVGLIASFVNTEANAQWPADQSQLGTANGSPLCYSSPPIPVVPPHCWAPNSQEFPPLANFLGGPNSASVQPSQHFGTQPPLSPRVPPLGDSFVPEDTNPSCGNYDIGSTIPPIYGNTPFYRNTTCANNSSYGYFAPSCGAPVPTNQFYGGFEFLWMRAHFDQNVAMIVDPPIGNTLTPFHYNFDLTPRTWLGWQSACSGAGFRATYWQFDAAAAEERATAVAGATPVYLFVYGAGGNLSRNAYADLGETLVSNHRLKLQTLDLEGTQKFSLASLQCLAGVGVRLAEMDQHLRGDVYDASNVLWEIVTNDLSFRGAGPTASLQIQRCLGNSRFSVFHGLRGALLVSDTHQGIYEMKDGFANEVTDVAEQTEVLSMGELALGMQYSQSIGPRAQFFVRGNYECQAWFDVGGPVDSHSTLAFSGIGVASGLLY